jgi:DnaJ like chaperone protein
MAIGKWIGGFLGFIGTGSILGALAGFALGSLFDSGLDAVNTPNNSGTFNHDDAFGPGSSRQQQFQHSQRQYQYNQQRDYEGQRNSFRFSLLVLATYIIKADGRVMHSEMETVRRFLRQNFGEIAVRQGEEIMLKLFEQQKQMGAQQYRSVIRSACEQIAQHMDYYQRLQLLNFLVMIAQADGSVAPAEISALREVCAYLGLSAGELDSMLHLRENDLDSAYKVLGISPKATNDEVKAAYRKMALKHHPDRVATLGDDVKKAAEKKFQEINDAKERIYKARGL